MKNNKKGFTLVELVIVVAVMAVLVAVAIPTVSSIVGTAEEAVDNSNARTIESLIKLKEAELSNNGGSLDADAIDEAITAGKLGIDGTFVYDSNKGTVAASDAALTAGQFQIVCDSDAEATTNPALTAEQNSVKVTAYVANTTG